MDSALPKPDHILAAAATRHFDHDARLPTRESTARHLGSYTRRPPTQLHNHRPGPDPGGRASARPEVASTVSPQFSAGPTPESRASARLEVGSTSAFSFNTPATPTPFVFVPGTPVFIFGATEAASAPLDPPPLHDHQQHFRQSSIDELYEADLHARTALLAARLARTLDPAAMSWQGHRLSYTAAPPLSPPTSLPLRDFSHLTYTFQMFQRTAGRMQLTGPADDLAEFKELVSLGFQPFIRGYASYAFAFYATYHEACRWARENGHRSRPVFWQAGSPSGPFKLMCDHDIKVLRDRIRATSEVGPIKSRLHTRGYDIPAVRCIQRVVRRHLAKAKRDITEDDLDQPGSSSPGLQSASSGLCAAISVIAPTYLAGSGLPMQFHPFPTLQWSFLMQPPPRYQVETLSSGPPRIQTTQLRPPPQPGTSAACCLAWSMARGRHAGAALRAAQARFIGIFRLLPPVA
jgi:hypothetical protein